LNPHSWSKAFLHFYGSLSQFKLEIQDEGGEPEQACHSAQETKVAACFQAQSPHWLLNLVSYIPASPVELMNV
jgi:hypothetical protein